MRVTCPACAATFEMPDSAVDDAGRRVRCGACAHVWRAYPEAESSAAGPAPDSTEGFGAGYYDTTVEAAEASDGEAESDNPFAALQESLTQDSDVPERETGEAPSFAAYADAHDDDDALYGAAGLPALPPGRSRLVMAGWIAYAVFMIMLIGGLVLFRAPLVNAWPPLEGVYTLFAESRPTAESAFRVEIDPQPVWEDSGDSWTMTVSGRVTNIHDRNLALPPLRIELVDQRNAAVRAAEADLNRRRLDPGESTTFTVMIDNAPEQARGIDYRWETSGE